MTTFCTISSASVGANTSTPLSTSITSDSYNSSNMYNSFDKASAFGELQFVRFNSIATDSSQLANSGPMSVNLGPTTGNGNISGLRPGLHCFQVHALWDIINGCMLAGSHFNPGLSLSTLILMILARMVMSLANHWKCWWHISMRCYWSARLDVSLPPHEGPLIRLKALTEANIMNNLLHLGVFLLVDSKQSLQHVC